MQLTPNAGRAGPAERELSALANSHGKPSYGTVPMD